MAKSNLIDKEAMYRKIMPTNTRLNDTVKTEEQQNAPETVSEPNPTLTQNKNIQNFFHAKDNLFPAEKGTGLAILNLTEKLVIAKLEVALKRMSCCKCDRCKKDIIALSLNNLKPHYIVGTMDDSEKMLNMDEQNLDVTSAILKAVLTVRKNPRH